MMRVRNWVKCKKCGLIIFEKSNRGDMNNFNIAINANRLCNIGNCDTRLIWKLLSRSTSAHCSLIKKEYILMKNSNIEKALKEAKEQLEKTDNDCIKNMIRIFIESLEDIK